jgi:hypothetical protein
MRPTREASLSPKLRLCAVLLSLEEVPHLWRAAVAIPSRPASPEESRSKPSTRGRSGPPKRKTHRPSRVVCEPTDREERATGTARSKSACAWAGAHPKSGSSEQNGTLNCRSRPPLLHCLTSGLQGTTLSHVTVGPPANQEKGTQGGRPAGRGPRGLLGSIEGNADGTVGAGPAGCFRSWG